MEGGNEAALAEHCGNGLVDAVDLFLEAGADINLTGRSQTTPLGTAAMQGHLVVTERLLQAGASANKATATNGSMPLHLAARSGFAKVAQVPEQHRGHRCHLQLHS